MARSVMLVAAVLAAGALWILSNGAARAISARSAPATAGEEAPSSVHATRIDFEAEAACGESAAEGTRFHVLSRSDGGPIEGAIVAMGKLRGSTAWDGTVLLPGPAESWYEVSAPAHMPTRGDIRVEGWTIWVELTPATNLAGVVLDTVSRQPLPGAEVHVRELGSDSWIAGAIADDAGRFGVEAPLREPFVLVASAEGFASSCKRRLIEGPLLDEEILLGVGGVVEGSLAGGGPYCASMYVALVPIGDLTGGFSRAGWFSEGSFRFENVPLDVEYEPVANGDILEAAGAPLRFQQHGQSARRDLALPRPAGLRVLAKGADGAPIDDFHLTLWLGGARRPWVGWCHRGAWSFFGGLQGEIQRELPADGEPIRIMPGRWSLMARFDGWMPQEREIVVAEGEEVETAFTFSDGAAIEGKVVDTAGEPVPANVWCKSWGRVETDPQGRFRISGLPRTAQTLCAEAKILPREFPHSPHALFEQEGVLPGGPQVVVVLRPAARLVVRMVEVPDGTRLDVAVCSSADVSHRTAVLTGGRLEQDYGRLGEPALIAVRADGFGAPAVLPVAPLEAGEVRDLGEVRLDHGRVVRGRIVGPDGGGVGAAKVTVAEGWSYASVRTDAEGRFVILRMPSKPIWLCVEAEGFGKHACRLDRDPGEIRLASPGFVEARCPATITPVLDGPDVERDRTRSPARAAEGGVFRASLQPGRYRATFGDFLKAREVEFVVYEGQTTLLR